MCKNRQEIMFTTVPNPVYACNIHHQSFKKIASTRGCAFTRHRHAGAPMVLVGETHGGLQALRPSVIGLCAQRLLLLLIMAADKGISRSVPAMVAIRALAGSPAAGSMLVPATSHTG